MAVNLRSSILYDRWNEINGKARSKAQVILNDLECANYDLLENLDDDVIGRFRNILFVWHDLACREIERRYAERGR